MLAELNVLLQAYQHLFAEVHLYDQQVFGRASAACTFAQLESHASRSTQPTAVLPATRAVLDACGDCHEVCLTLMELATPPFLAAWAAKWAAAAGGADGSRCTGGRLGLVVLEGWREGPAVLRASTVYNLGRPACATAAPSTTIYIPLL